MSLSITQHAIFQKFNDEEKKIIAKHILVETYLPDENIIKSNTHGDSLYIILNGRAEASDVVDDTKHSYQVFSEGNIFGEISFLTQKKRILDVTAITAVEVARLSNDLRYENPNLFLRIKNNLLENVKNHIVSNNQKQIKYIKNEIKILKEQKFQNQVLLFIIFVFSISLTINKLLGSALANINIYGKVFTGTYLFLIVFPLLLLLLDKKIPIYMIGINNQNIIKNLLKSILYVIILTIIVLSFYYIAPLKHHQTLYEIASWFFNPWNYTYIYHVTLQQFLRTYFQNSLHNIYKDKFYISAILSSYCFGLLHIHMGFVAILVTFIAGLIFSIMYYRQKSVYGLILIQFFMGSLMFSLKIFESFI